MFTVCSRALNTIMRRHAQTIVIPWEKGMLANVDIMLTGPQRMFAGHQHNLNIRQHAQTIDIP